MTVFDNILILIFFCFQSHMLFMDAFLQNNRLDHVSRVMSSHPSYLEHFLRTQNFILRGDGPLPYDYRHLIAIMVRINLIFNFSTLHIIELHLNFKFIFTNSYFIRIMFLAFANNEIHSSL